MSGDWTVKSIYTPREKPNGQPALIDGSPFAFFNGDKLARDDAKTASEEKEGVLIRQWFWLSDNDLRHGFVPYNPVDPDDVRSVATEWAQDMPPPFQFHLFDAEISRDSFAENCVRKAIRWHTNAAYLYALAIVESGDQWPAGNVNSPPAKPGELTVGTFQFLPATWKTLVDKIGAEQQIVADDIAFPEAQVTFAASQAGDATEELEKQLSRKPRYVDIRLAHLFTIKGALTILDPANATKPMTEVLEQAYADIEPTSRAERIAALFLRKKALLKDAAGKDVTAVVLVQNCIAELDKGFQEVSAVAAAMIPQGTNAGGNTGTQAASSDTLGVLSEEFESNGDPAAIGFDSTGGWSYGKYQIASRKGRFKHFLDWLGKNGFDDLKAKLNAAGGDDAARAGTDSFKKFWKSLKGRSDFIPAQHGFIKATHYDVMVQFLKSALDVQARSIALQNVVWSIAVQHGPNSGIVKKAIDAIGANAAKDDGKLINAIYDERSKVNVYFSSSSAKVKASVLARFGRERKGALAML